MYPIDKSSDRYSQLSSPAKSGSGRHSRSCSPHRRSPLHLSPSRLSHHSQSRSHSSKSYQHDGSPTLGRARSSRRPSAYNHPAPPSFGVFSPETTAGYSMLSPGYSGFDGSPHMPLSHHGAANMQESVIELKVRVKKLEEEMAKAQQLLAHAHASIEFMRDGSLKSRDRDWSRRSSSSPFELLKEAIEEGFKPTESLKEGEPPGYDTMRAPDQFPHVSAWTRTKFNAKMGKNAGTVKVGAITSARGHTLIARGINSTAQYLEHTDGTLADAHYMTQARDVCKALLSTAEACGRSLPREWKDVDPRLVAILVNALRTLSVLHQLSLDNFKAQKTFMYVYYETRTRKALASSSKSLLDDAPFTIDDRSTPAPSAPSLPPSGFTFTSSTLPAKAATTAGRPNGPQAPRPSAVPDSVLMLPSINPAPPECDISIDSDIPIDPALQLNSVPTRTPAHMPEAHPSSSSSTPPSHVEPPASTSLKRPALDALTESAPGSKRQHTGTPALTSDSVLPTLAPRVCSPVKAVSKDKAQETPVTIQDTSFDLLDMEPRPLPNALADYLAPIAPGTRVTTAPDSLMPGASSKRSGKGRAPRKPAEWPPTASTPKWLYAREWYEKEQGTLDAFEVHWNALPQDEKTKTIPARMKKKKLATA